MRIRGGERVGEYLADNAAGMLWQLLPSWHKSVGDHLLIYTVLHSGIINEGSLITRPMPKVDAKRHGTENVKLKRVFISV